MKKKINFAMLVDDNKFDNYFHERIIKKSKFINTVVSKRSAQEALDFIIKEEHENTRHPDLIFLDINMPGMNGWEFAEEYYKIHKKADNKTVIVMLSTSSNPDDLAKAEKCKVLADFKTKPLTKEMLTEIAEKYFVD